MEKPCCWCGESLIDLGRRPRQPRQPQHSLSHVPSFQPPDGCQGRELQEEEEAGRGWSRSLRGAAVITCGLRREAVITCECRELPVWEADAVQDFHGSEDRPALLLGANAAGALG